MKNENLPNDKFTTAKLPEICAPRHGLLNLFRRETDKRIIYVSAPAGYGKTVSTQLWLQHAKCEYIWIGLDEYDNTLSIFYKLFCSGILSFQPGNRAIASIIASPKFYSAPVEHTIHLLSAFEPDGKKYALVFDDMHLVTNEEIRKSALLVQKRLPLSFLTLILTRNEVAKEYLATTGEERCAVISAKDLAFSTEEIRAYFRAYGRSLTREEAVEVQGATKGWAIGVNALAISGQTESCQGSDQMLESYIKKQIWDNWDAKLQDFLLKTSAADDLSPGLCKHLTGRTDSIEVLETLCSSNAFISRISEDTYQYHHLFREFLRDRLNRDHRIDKRELYRQTAEWFYKRKEYLKAANYYIHINDSKKITDCLILIRDYTLDNNIEPLLAFTKRYILGKLSKLFIEENLGLVAHCAMSCFWDGDSSGFCHYLDILYTIQIEDPAYAETISFLGGIDFRIPFYVYASEHAKKLPVDAAPSRQEDKRAKVMSLTQNLPFIHRSSRDYSEFSVHTKERLAQLESTFGLLIGREYYVFEECIRAGLCFEKNLLADALAYGLTALVKCEDGFGIEVKFCTHMILAAVYQAMDKWPDALKQIKEMEALMETSGAGYLRPNLLAVLTGFKQQDGQKAVAEEWLGQYFVTEKASLELYKISQHFTTTRAYIIIGETGMAMEYTNKLKQLGADYKRPLDAAEAGVLKAALEWILGQKYEAMDTMEAVLVDMQEYGFIRIIANEGAAVLPILKKLDNKIQKDTYGGQVQSVFLHEVILAAHMQSKRHKGITANLDLKPVRLSKQQKLILTYLSKGYKYKDIVDATGLSIHTVKSHASSAYAKLGVGNSVDAVLKVRDLGMIE